MLCCNVKETQVIPMNKNNNYREITFLNDNDTAIIESTWNLLVELKHTNILMEHLFKRFFEIDPKSLDLFFRFDDSNELYDSYAFKHHCELFAFHVGLGVKYIKDKEKLMKFLEQLGVLHNNIFLIRENYGNDEKKNHSNMNEHFYLSEKALQMALDDELKEKNTPEIKNAWKLFYKLMIDVLMNHIDVCNRPAETVITVEKKK